MNPEDIPNDAIIEHEQGSVPEREIREPVAKYGSKKKKNEVQVQSAPPVTTTMPPAPVLTMPHHQPLDPHSAAAMWVYAQQARDMRNDHDQSSNSNY